MPTYCYRCDACGARLEIPAIGQFGCPECEDGELRRDWKAESANPLIANLKQERENAK